MSPQAILGRLSKVRKVIEISWHDDVEHRPGVYLLREIENGPVRYIGLADTDLRSVFLIHDMEFIDHELRYYSYRCAEDNIQAYELACKYFHQYRSTLFGCEHPACPISNDMECPVHSCDQ